MFTNELSEKLIPDVKGEFGWMLWLVEDAVVHTSTSLSLWKSVVIKVHYEQSQVDFAEL